MRTRRGLVFDETTPWPTERSVNTKQRLLPLLSFALLVFGSAVARADTVVHSTRPDFNNVTTGNTIVTFNGIAPSGSFVPYGTSGSVTISGVTFSSGPTNLLFVIDEGFGLGYDTGSASQGGVLSSQSGTALQTLNISFPSLITAVGFDTNTFNDATIIANLSNGAVLTYTTSGSDGRFFGFNTDVGIISLQLQAVGSNALNIDDFTFGTAASVPEPATLLLLGSGLIAAGAVHRRRKAAKD